MWLIRLVGVLSLCYCMVVANSSSEDELLQLFHRGMQKVFDRQPGLSRLHRRVNQTNKVDEIIGHPQVHTDQGNIKGQTNSYAHSFFGIPYAEPPKRFEDPVEVEFKEEIDASEESRVICYQQEAPADFYTMSEDCLILNIHVPRSIDHESLTTNSTFDELKPVMFWIFGGGFQSGTGMVESTDGRYLSSSSDTVVVTFNYRLGPLGFLLLEENNDDGGVTTYGNQGFKDQQLALKWVNKNIQQFGGDPEKVTIFGESAGAQSVMLHLASTVNDLYFKRAIMESNPAVYHYPTIDQAKQLTDDLVAKLDCGEEYDSDIECLRNLDPSAIITAERFFSVKGFLTGDSQSIIEPFRPYVDVMEFTQQPLAMFQDGDWNTEVDVILGTNREELGYFNVLFNRHDNITIIKRLFKFLNLGLLGNKTLAATATEKYSELAPELHSPFFDYGDIFAKEVGDLYFVCPTRTLARFISKSSKSKNNYLYSWEHGHLDDPKKIGSYSCHACEIPYVFNSTDYVQAEDDEILMTKLFSDLWGSFAHTGTPTSDLAEEWPRYELNVGDQGEEKWQNLHLIYPFATVEENYMDELCDFWESLDLYVEIKDEKAEEAKQSKQIREDL